MRLALVVIALLMGQLVLTLPADADGWRHLDDGYFNVTFLAPANHLAEPEEVLDDDGTTIWYRNVGFIDDTYFNRVGTMRALNESYDVMGMNLTRDAQAVADAAMGKIVYTETITIPTYDGNRTGVKNFIDVGMGDYFLYGVIPLDQHAALLFGGKASEMNFFPSLSVNQSATVNSR